MAAADYDVSFRFTNDTQWTATFEVWGPNPQGRGNGVVVLLRPHDAVAFMVNASTTYFYCLRHHGLETRFSVQVRFDTMTTIAEIVPPALPANYHQITNWPVMEGITIRRLRPLAHHISG
ncbi:hypothetical protein FA95DRAFT_1554303, partial [Auriscalpium vulgare]